MTECDQTVLIKMFVLLLEHVRIFFKPKFCSASQRLIYKPKHVKRYMPDIPTAKF